MKKTLLVLLLLLLLAPPAAARPRIDACATIIDSLHADWLATRGLLQRYGPEHEINPVIRVTGADPYFIILILAAGATCQDTPTWRRLALGTWLVQTWAVNTHSSYGTVVRPPLLIVTIRF